MDYSDVQLSEEQLLELVIYESLYSSINMPSIKIPNTKVGNIISKKDELHIPCPSSSLAAIILFPADNDPTFTINDEDLQKRMHYLAREYNVYLQRVYNLSDAIAITRTIKQFFDIGHMELAGHGSATTLSWPRQVIRVGKCTDELTILFSMLQPDAAIMTLSCYNGKSISGSNILDYFARIARGHRVIGTSTSNGKHLRLKISSAKPFIIEYTDMYGRNVTVTKIYH